MARAGVYRTDVEKARRALVAQGKHPLSTWSGPRLATRDRAPPSIAS